MLSQGQIEDVITELQRLSSLGSNSACALLAYLMLRGINATPADRNITIKMCCDGANHGHGYSQYVMAMIEYERGNQPAFRLWLERSAKTLFPPAIGDLGRLAISGRDKTPQQRAIAKRLFRRAVLRGHLPSIYFCIGACIRGTFGMAMRPIGVIIWPVAALFLMPIFWWNPFSVAVFSHHLNTNRPLFARNTDSG
jgi:TPR repeat protein